jgi:hypothetical protein
VEVRICRRLLWTNSENCHRAGIPSNPRVGTPIPQPRLAVSRRSLPNLGCCQARNAASARRPAKCDEAKAARGLSNGGALSGRHGPIETRTHSPTSKLLAHCCCEIRIAEPTDFVDIRVGRIASPASLSEVAGAGLLDPACPQVGMRAADLSTYKRPSVKGQLRIYPEWVEGGRSVTATPNLPSHPL